MDFMNLNQAAHGDREFGYILTRLGINRKIVVGHYTDPEVAEQIATWTRACAGWDASNNMKVMRWGDNMRNVAVTEGDKTEAERVFGASINTWAVNELCAAYDAVKDDQVKEHRRRRQLRGPRLPAAAAGRRPAALPIRVRFRLLRRGRLEDRRARAYRRRDGVWP